MRQGKSLKRPIDSAWALFNCAHLESAPQWFTDVARGGGGWEPQKSFLCLEQRQRPKWDGNPPNPRAEVPLHERQNQINVEVIQFDITQSLPKGLLCYICRLVITGVRNTVKGGQYDEDWLLWSAGETEWDEGKETKNSTQTVEGWSVQRRSCCAEIKMGVKTFQRLQRFLRAERQEGGERQKKAKPGWAGTAGRAGCKTVRKFLFSTEALIGHLTWQLQTPVLRQKWCVKCRQSQSLPSSISGRNWSCSMVFI